MINKDKYYKSKVYFTQKKLYYELCFFWYHFLKTDKHQLLMNV